MKAARMGAGAVKAALAVTDWFEDGSFPSRTGDYQIFPLTANDIRWSHWNGIRWSYFTLNQAALVIHRHKAIHTRPFPWRGLAADPAKAGEK